MTDPQPTAATDDVVDLVRITCDEKFGNLIGELTSHRDAAAFVAALEQRGVVLLLEGELDRGSQAPEVRDVDAPAVCKVSPHVTLNVYPGVDPALEAALVARLLADPQWGNP
ncbi:hypothetical protein [Cellulosimicrobium cellulans]|uniref:hypothetical protein n=1 Tax=Cellulosimicrobium cellulans TaxID=1710 RepID=UPI001BACD2E5|nr:hypothetical protein [Cellulosimicrobium cellulans]QUC01210.1 hypothetical protein J5A69_08635 [Cellulosimicrobium cellulans]